MSSQGYVERCWCDGSVGNMLAAKLRHADLQFEVIWSRM
jgi:hypothetical protein